MKNTLILMLSVFAVFGLNAQSMAEANVNQMAATSGDEPMTLSQYFKKNVMDWNVGNLHVFPEDQNNTEKAYYYEGEMMEKKYYRLLPYQLQNKVIRGSKFYSVSAIRGNDLNDDFYILREEAKNGDQMIYLADIQNNRFKIVKKLASISRKGNTIQRTDSWIKDLDGDSLLDIVQKKTVMEEDGDVLKESYKVFRHTKDGKLKRNKKIRIDQGNYMVK